MSRKTDDRPNILPIITDHHAWFDHFGPGRTNVSFPNRQNFCAQDVRSAGDPASLASSLLPGIIP